MKSAFSDLHFDSYEPVTIIRLIDGHDVQLLLGIEFDDCMREYLDMTCDGEPVAFNVAELDHVMSSCEWHDFDNPEVQEALSNALKRHLAGKVVL